MDDRVSVVVVVVAADGVIRLEVVVTIVVAIVVTIVVVTVVGAIETKLKHPSIFS